MATATTNQPNALYNPATNQLIDILRPDGTTFYGKQTIEQVRAEYGEQVEALDIDEAIQRQADSHKKPARETDFAEFDQMLNIMYPGGWVRGQGDESFYMTELWSGTISDIFVRIGSRFFSLRDDINLTHQERVAKCTHLLGA